MNDVASSVKSGPGPSSPGRPRGATFAMALIAGVAAWAAISLVAAARFGEPTLHPRDFIWKSPTGEPHRIEVSRPLELPYPMRDFDWHLTVELAEASELDLILRKVEPRLRRTPDGGSDLIPFHGRFAVLRLTTDEESADSVGWRTGEAALFDARPADAPTLSGGRLGGGLRLRPGVPASVWIRGRGRTMHANVAGRELPPFRCVDAHGDFAIITRSGRDEDGARRPTLLHHLKILNHRARSPDPVWRARWWAAGIAMLSALGIGWPRRSPWWRVATGTLAIVVGGGLAGRVLFGESLPWAEPAQWALVAGGLLGLPLAWLAWCAPSRLGTALPVAVLAVGGSFVLAEVVVRVEEPRLAPFQDPRLTEFFGPESATAPFDALAIRLRSKLRVQTIDPDGDPILYFGGELLLEAGASPFVDHGDGIQYAAERTTLDVRRDARRDLDTVLVPTQMAMAAQQWRLWQRFYSEFPTPVAFVFGVSPAEEVGGLAAPPTTERSWSRLVDLWTAADRDALPPAGPEELVGTMRAATQWFVEREIPVCWVAHEAMAPEHREAIERAAKDLGIVFEPRFVGLDQRPNVERVARELTRRLRR